jgi:hypothetical protein
LSGLAPSRQGCSKSVAVSRLWGFLPLRFTQRESMNCINQVIKDQYAAYHGDCVEVLRGLPDASIGYSIFSPPFAANQAVMPPSFLVAA